MYRITLTRLLLTASLSVCMLAVFPQQAQASSPDETSPVQLQFDKQGGANGIWNGTVGGDIVGDLTTQLRSLEQAGPVLKVSFAWIVTAEGQSFRAVLDGTLNTLTGRVEMNGTVVEGWLIGAQVHEEGQLIDPSVGRFQGTIAIFPATAD